MNASNTVAKLTQRDIQINVGDKEPSRKEIRESSKKIGSTEARFLVDAYYVAQEHRIAMDNQIRSMLKDGEHNLVLTYLSAQATTRESIIKKALDDYTIDHPVGSWMRTISGIGPVTAAGLLAHIDINKAPTAGAIWAFGGIDGVAKWNKGEKRPWNASLKTLFYKIGESFVKTSGKETSYYGRLYKQRKELETAKNMNGDYADKAAAELASKNYKAGTVTHTALSSGRLSAAHIHARARRYAVKIFISHLHEVMYKTILGKNPPAPFAIAILGHAHQLRVPNPEHIRAFVDPVEITSLDKVEGDDEQ